MFFFTIAWTSQFLIPVPFPSKKTSYSFGDVLLYIVGNAVDGKFENGIRSYGFAEGIINLAPYHSFEDRIPQDVKDEIEDLKQQIIDGSLVIPVIETPTT